MGERQRGVNFNAPPGRTCTPYLKVKPDIGKDVGIKSGAKTEKGTLWTTLKRRKMHIAPNNTSQHSKKSFYLNNAKFH